MIDIIFPELPSSQDKLFTSAEDWWNNACLNFFSHGWTIYATGYKDAADILVEHIAKTKRQQDTLIYPIIFLYRQYLELALKDLILDARKLLDDLNPLSKTHRIDELWRICDRLLEQISPGDSAESRKEIGRLMEEFGQVDPLSMSFRYPEDKNGNPTLPGMDYINMRNVNEVVRKISIILEGAGAMIYESLSYKSEI
ncbi:MAG: hypothetical protein ACLPYB_11440 [Desulfobaccales bacterium]